MWVKICIMTDGSAERQYRCCYLPAPDETVDLHGTDTTKLSKVLKHRELDTLQAPGRTDSEMELRCVIVLNGH